jgi:hypothetical protein
LQAGQFGVIGMLIFDGGSVSLGRWRFAFRDEFSLILHRDKPSIKALLKNWLSSS